MAAPGILLLLLLSSGVAQELPSGVIRNEAPSGVHPDEAPSGPPGGTPGDAPILLDRVVALVDTDPILLSEVERVIALGLVPEAGRGEGEAAVRRRVLDGLIEQRLRLHEIARSRFGEVDVRAVEAEVERLRAEFPDEVAFQAKLAELELDLARLRQLLAGQLLTLAYVEERLGPRVFVGLEEIRRHYEEVLVPDLRARGAPVPPLEQVREPIRELLKEQRLDVEIARWTAELRREADVIDLLDREPGELPPAVPLPPPR